MLWTLIWQAQNLSNGSELSFDKLKACQMALNFNFEFSFGTIDKHKACQSASKPAQAQIWLRHFDKL